MNKKISLIASLSLAFLAPLSADAAANNWLVDTIDKIINQILWPFFIGLVIIMAIWAGFLFLGSAGDPGKRSQAVKALIFIVIGVTVALLANSFVKTIQSIITPPAQQNPPAQNGGAAP